MEAPLKQRLVGAAVLVAAAVIVVPMLLDGGYRPRPQTVNDMAPMPADEMPASVPPLPYGLTTEVEQGLDAEPATLESVADSVVPEPDTAPTPPPAHITRPPQPQAAPRVAAPVPAAPKLAPAPAAVPSPSVETSKGERWAVQLGSFSSRSNADLLVRRLSAQGTKAHMVQIKDAKGVSFRVRAGPVDGYEAALDLRNKLAKSPDLRGILVRE